MYYLFEDLTEGEKISIEELRSGLKPGLKYFCLLKNNKDDTIGSQVHLELYEECIVYMHRNGIKSKDIAHSMEVTPRCVLKWKSGGKNYDRLFERLMDDKKRSRLSEGIS